jgi:hypothetical protein
VRKLSSEVILWQITESYQYQIHSFLNSEWQFFGKLGRVNPLSLIFKNIVKNLFKKAGIAITLAQYKLRK